MAWSPRVEQLEPRTLLALTPFDLGQLLAANGGDGSDGVVFQAGNSGDAVSNLGDISGDGIDDYAVAAPGSAVAGNPGNSGQTFVVFGNGAGFGAEFDLTTLNGTNGFVAAGVDNGERSGDAIAAAGDVNNDGIDDFIISAPQADPNALNNAGRTYVVFGRDVSVDPFPAAFQLSSLLAANGGDGSQGFVLNGVAADDLSGNSVGGEGDFNGDAIPDIIIGAANADHNGNNAGASYVVFGRDAAVNPFAAEIELSSLLAANFGDGSDGVVIHGTAAMDLSGISVSPAGDFNNDGFDDLIIGASEANSPGGFNEEPGESYLLFGRDAAVNPFPAEFFLSDLFDANGGNGTDGVVFIGINSFFGGGDHLGRMVGSAGDINNDGFDDLLLGAPDANQDQLNGPGAKGEAYIIFGRSDVSATLGAEFPLADLLPAGGGDGSQGIVFPGVDFGDNSGASLAPVGDVNNDGIDDLIIGAQGGTPHGSRSGEAYVFFGSAAPMPAVFDVNNLDGFNGLILHGVGPLDDTGGVQLTGTVEVSAISGGGDLNNDGIDDLIIGAPGRDESFVVFGGNLDGNGIVEPVPYSFDLGGLLPSNGGDGTRGFAIHSDESISDFGTSVNAVGDVNNDGIDDFIIGDPPSGGGFRGRTFVIFGSTTPFPAELSAGDVDGTNGFFLRGIPGGNFDGMGIQVAGAGDLNGDGIGDLIASTVDGDEGGATAATGQVYVIFGRDTGVNPFPQEIALETLLPANGGDGSVGFVIRGVSNQDKFGTGLDGVGDFNNDGFDDIIIGAQQAETFSGVNNSGESYVIFGRDASVNPFGAIFEASSLAAANGGDGSAGLLIKGIDVNDRSGVSANGAGDFNNDGIDDVIIGASSSLNSAPGEFYVLFGFDAATNPLGAEFDLSDLLVANGGDGSQGFVGLGNVNGDRTGTSVNGAGDINDDGFDDIIVSAPNANSNASGDDTGEIYVIFGRSDANSIGAEFSVSSLLPANGGDGTDGFVLSGINFGDQLGGAVNNAGDVVSSAGDVNNDGFADIIVGASRATPHGTQSGQSYLLLGSGAPFPAVVELSSLTAASGVAFNGFQVNEESGDSVAAAGDINNDGFGDLIIGAQNAKTGTFQTGRVYVVYGGPFGCSTTVTNTDNSGSGSLRAAIECANFLPTLDTIDFDIPGPGTHTILLIGDLPTITDRTIIDGTTEPGYAGTPVVQLLSGFNTNGFDFTAGGTVRGMAIDGFENGVHITSGAGYTIEHNTFSRNDVAIDVQNASDLTVRDNTISKDEATGLAATGIQLFDTAGTNIVRDNVVNFSAASGDNPFIEPQGINLRGTGLFTVTNNDVSIPLGIDGVGFTVGDQVSIVFGAGNSVTGGRDGIQLSEVFGDILDDSLNDFQFMDQTGDFISLGLGFMQGPQILDATNVVFGDATLSPPGPGQHL